MTTSGGGGGQRTGGEGRRGSGTRGRERVDGNGSNGRSGGSGVTTRGTAPENKCGTSSIDAECGRNDVPRVQGQKMARYRVDYVGDEVHDCILRDYNILSSDCEPTSSRQNTRICWIV